MGKTQLKSGLGGNQAFNHTCMSSQCSATVSTSRDKISDNICELSGTFNARNT